MARNVRIIQHDDEWNVSLDGEALMTNSRKIEAFDFARAIAKQKKVDLVVENPDGSVAVLESFRPDTQNDAGKQ